MAHPGPIHPKNGISAGPPCSQVVPGIPGTGTRSKKRSPSFEEPMPTLVLPPWFGLGPKQNPLPARLEAAPQPQGRIRRVLPNKLSQHARISHQLGAAPPPPRRYRKLFPFMNMGMPRSAPPAPPPPRGRPTTIGPAPRPRRRKRSPSAVKGMSAFKNRIHRVPMRPPPRKMPVEFHAPPFDQKAPPFPQSKAAPRASFFRRKPGIGRFLCHIVTVFVKEKVKKVFIQIR